MQALATFVREGDLKTGETRALRIEGIGFGDTVFLDANNQVTRVRDISGHVTHVPSWKIQQVINDKVESLAAIDAE
jgi:hypothetical protein